MDANVGLNIRNVINLGIQNIKLSGHKIAFSSDIRVLSENEFHNRINEPNLSNLRGATDNPKQRANGTEKLARLSAFKDDKINNCLRPGSFTNFMGRLSNL